MLVLLPMMMMMIMMMMVSNTSLVLLLRSHHVMTSAADTQHLSPPRMIRVPVADHIYSWLASCNVSGSLQSIRRSATKSADPAVFKPKIKLPRNTVFVSSE